MKTPFLSNSVYTFLFSLLAIVYIIGLFIPLMDNDSAHHANIALRMHLTGDYVSLIDHGKDYLDKPHLHFWLCAFSYKIFGVTAFAYKFPSFLFSLLGVYSTYRLAKSLYDKETGKLASLILASSFAYVLANNDVRMDAILTSCIAFATWQLVDLIQSHKISNVFLAALGLALGFSVKGHIGVVIPCAAAFFYILYLRQWRLFLRWNWLLMVILFALFISPVVYCYYLQYNLHPEKVVRGKDHINGVKFILFGQSIERFQGDNFGGNNKRDYLFFLHTFLWAFAPWSVLAYIAVAGRIKTLFRRKQEWLTLGAFLIMLLIVSFSGFKLPHYLNIIFPFAAVMTAVFILEKKESLVWVTRIYIIQLIIVFLLLVILTIINAWVFPVRSICLIIIIVLLLAIVFYFIKTQQLSKIQKSVTVSVALVVLIFFSLNSNFYPALLKYQGGNELAFTTKGKIDPADVYFWKETYSSSFKFYTISLGEAFTDSALRSGRKCWLLFDIKDEKEIKQAGYKLGQRFSVLDFEITKLSISFLNPEKREGECSRLVLSEISK